MTITFKVSEVETAEKPLNEVDALDIIKAKVRCENLESCSAGKLVYGNTNPLIYAANLAYDRHRELRLSPDSIWLTIASGLASHINSNAEELRHHFVDFEDKKYIEILRNGFVKGNPDNDWQGCFPEFSDKIGEFIGKKKDLIVSDFSTTGPIEKAASELVLMDAMQSYFDYGVKTMCGIPWITLEGTKEDWESIHTRVSQFNEFGLEWWTNHLLTVLDKIIETSDKEPDIDFWKSFFKLSGGSGGPYISGWVNVFFPYLTGYKNKLRINSVLKSTESFWNTSSRGFGGPSPESFPNGLSKIPFKWLYYDQQFEMEFLGGLIGVKQHDDLSLSPSAGWAVRDKAER